MKKSVVFYSIAWVIVAAVINVVTFVVPNVVRTIPSFWIGYGFVMASLAVQLIIGIFIFSADKKQVLFLRMPLHTISYSLLCTSLVVDAVIMAVPVIPKWVAAIVCTIIAGFYAIAYLKGIAAGVYANEVGQKVEKKTALMYDLRAEAEGLIVYAKTEEEKQCTKRVSDTLKYSDPMSDEKLYYIEKEISDALIIFADMIKNHASAGITEQADKIIVLIQDRNVKCKALKR